MKLFKNFFAAFIAIAALGLTIAANAESNAKKAAQYQNCATFLTVNGVTYDADDNIVPPSIAGQFAQSGSYSLGTITCDNSGKFCCAQLDPATREVLQVIEKD